MPTNKTQPWKETRPTRCIRFSDSEWHAIDKAARAARKTKADYVRDAVLPALVKLGLLVLMLVGLSCGGRTDLEPPPEDDVGGRTDLFVPLGAGIRTDIADALLPLGHDLEAENVQFDQTGSLVKRFGNFTQPTTIQPGGAALPQIWQLATHRSARVALAQPGIAPLGTYSQGDGAWNLATSDRRGPITTMLTKLKAGGNNPRIAMGGGFYYLLYLDLQTSGVMHFDVVDAMTGHIAVSQTFQAAGVPVFGFDVIFCNGFAVAVTAETGVGIVFRRMTPASKTFTTTTFAATFASTAFDATAANAATISVVYANNTAKAAGVDFVPSTLTATGFAIHDATAATIPLDLGGAWMDDFGASGAIALVTASSTQGIRTQWNLSAGATRTAAATLNNDPTVTANVGQLTGFTTSANANGTFTVLATVIATPNTNNVTRWSGCNSGTVLPASVLYRSLTLLSRAWQTGGDYFALFSFPSLVTGDGNSYVMRIPTIAIGSQPALSAPQAQFAIRSSGNVDQFGVQNLGLSRVLTLSSAQVVTSIAYLNRIGEQAGASFSATTLGIELVTISYLHPTDSPTTGAPIEVADSLIVPGGTIGQYDGVTYAEMGFAYAPQTPTFSTPGAGGAMTDQATYFYVLVYSFMDAQGRLWRSGTSIPTSTFLVPGQHQVNVFCPTLRVTGRLGTLLAIELYRGAANDENLFQKVGQIANDITVDTVTFLDSFSDAALATGEELYTGQNGNAILNNDTIPGSTFVFIFQDRIWFISADDPTELWFSNIISPGNGPRFNSQNIVRIADAHGPVFAAGVVDDKVVALKGDAAYSWSGTGPDDAGNGAFSPAIMIASGLGTSNPRSVIATNEGVFFGSTSNRSGIQMFDKGLGVALDSTGRLFGAAVQKYGTEQIMSAVVVPQQSQVRFYCLSGRVLVYDLFSREWVTFLLSTGGAHVVSAIAVNGAVLVALDNQTLWIEDTTGFTYTDAGAAFGERIASPWISVDGVGGFQRVIQMIGRGATMGDHTLTVQELINFDDSTPVGTKTWNETVALTPLWNWEWNRPRVARMSSLKLVVTEVSGGAGFKAEGVSLMLGTRTGLNRQPTTTRGP